MKNCQHTGCNNEITREYHYHHAFWKQHHQCHGQDILHLCSKHAGTLIPVHSDQLEVIYQLQLINFKLYKMSQTGDDLKALVQRMTSTLQKIRVDVNTLANGIPEEGGLSAAETAELKTQLLGAVTEAENIDNLTPDPVEPTE